MCEKDDHGWPDPAWIIGAVCAIIGFAIGLAIGLSKVGIAL